MRGCRPQRSSGCGLPRQRPTIPTWDVERVHHSSHHRLLPALAGVGIPGGVVEGGHQVVAAEGGAEKRGDGRGGAARQPESGDTVRGRERPAAAAARSHSPQQQPLVLRKVQLGRPLCLLCPACCAVLCMLCCAYPGYIVPAFIDLQKALCKGKDGPILAHGRPAWLPLRPCGLLRLRRAGVRTLSGKARGGGRAAAGAATAAAAAAARMPPPLLLPAEREIPTLLNFLPLTQRLPLHSLSVFFLICGGGGGGGAGRRRRSLTVFASTCVSTALPGCVGKLKRLLPSRCCRLAALTAGG